MSTVVERLTELRCGRTLVLLTHRRLPLNIVDRVLTLNHGQLNDTTPTQPALADDVTPVLSGKIAV